MLCEPLSLRASSPFEGRCKKSRASSSRELGWLCLAVHSRALSQIASRATRDEESFLSSFPDLNLCATYDIYNNVFKKKYCLYMSSNILAEADTLFDFFFKKKLKRVFASVNSKMNAPVLLKETIFRL